MIEVPWHLLAVPRDLATHFLGVFARIEYALKAAGFVAGTAARVNADWRTFATTVSGNFQRQASAELDAAVGYLLNAPPLVQALQGGVLSWVPLQFHQGASELERLLLCVRTVRNNLFHGGKFFPNPNDPERDMRLVAASLHVLEAAYSLDPGVKKAFDV
jgi:hypothetical protein